MILELCRQIAGPGVGADDQQALRVGLRDLEPARDRRGGQPVDRHGADDHHEGDRGQLLRAGVAGLRQLEREDRGDGRRHDAARCDPGDQRALAPA